MSINIFNNQTTDAVVNTLNGKSIKADGNLQADVSGTLDGADFITFYIGADQQDVQIADCSWLAIDGEIAGGADGGTRYLNNRNIGFKIQNAGASTNISVNYSVEGC